MQVLFDSERNVVTIINCVLSQSLSYIYLICHMNKSWSLGVSDKLIYYNILVLLLCLISFDRIHLKEVCNSSSECRSFSFYCTLTNGKLIKVYSEITDVKRSFAKMIKAFQIVFHIFILSCLHPFSSAKYILSFQCLFRILFPLLYLRSVAGVRLQTDL